MVHFLLWCVTMATTVANVPPTLYIQSSVDCLEGGSVEINTLRADDADASQFLQSKIAVNITVQYGQIYLPIRAGLFFLHGKMSGSDSRYEIIGKLSDIQKSLSQVKYVADADFVGEDLLTVTAFDMHLQPKSEGSPTLALLADHAPVSAVAEITVRPVNDAPVLRTSTPFLTCPEQPSVVNNPLLLSGSSGTSIVSSVSMSATVVDVDVRTAEQAKNDLFSLSVSVIFGKLTMNIAGCDGSTNACAITDTLSAVNSALSNIKYTPDVAYNKFGGSERILITINDNGNTGVGGNKGAAATVPVIVQPVNHAPTILTSPTVVRLLEDQMLQLDASVLDVNDVDLRDTLTVNISVAVGGLLKLSPQLVPSFQQLLSLYHQQSQYLFTPAAGRFPYCLNFSISVFRFTCLVDNIFLLMVFSYCSNNNV